jgi:hypothetical protein
MASMNFLSRWNSRDFPLPLQTHVRTPALPGVGAVAVVAEEEAVEVEEVVAAVVG